jgi:hypothetical protein
MTGADVLDKAAQHLSDNYVFGVLVPKNNSNWRGPGTARSSPRGALFRRRIGCTAATKPGPG